MPMTTASSESLPVAAPRDANLTLGNITLKTMVVHTLTYFLAGLVAFNLFDYTARFAEPIYEVYMRPTNDPLVTAGVLFQPIRGILFGLVFYLLRGSIFKRKNGWLVAWFMLVVVGILSTFGPAPASIEGLIYTKLPIGSLPGGMAEVLTQPFLLASLPCYWVNHPGKRWVNVLLWILFAIALILPALGLLVAQSMGQP